MNVRGAWFLAGLFLTTLATLTLEILNTRLLSVLTWYHLSFFAVSTAMFGMAAGGVRVYLAGDRFEGEAAKRALAHFGWIFALAIPASHIVSLCIPIQVGFNFVTVSALLITTVAMAIPFYLSGILVALALTRIPGPTGLIYAIDLIGASLGSLAVIPLLALCDLSSATLICAAVAAAAATCFQRFTGRGSPIPSLALVALFLIGAAVNVDSPDGLRVIYTKGRSTPMQPAHEFWSIHGQVRVFSPMKGAPAYWGPGIGALEHKVTTIPMNIDGAAGTRMTRWDGDLASVGWVEYDVTSLPYHLRKGGDVAVIGVGGGRDLLTALWAGSRSVRGVEINKAFVHLHNGPYRDFTKLIDRPEVSIVHDEARSYLTRTPERFDILQMSLIDTFAATGAGAFTLSENGLYTVEGWKIFFDVLKPGGIFSVSRWYSPDRASETSRLLSLATAALLDRGIDDPSAHMALVARKSAATLLTSTQPLTRRDLALIDKASERFGFQVLVAPGRAPADPLLGRIVQSRTWEELERVVEHEHYDYTPPTDQRPYFFNILKPTSFVGGDMTKIHHGVLGDGNLLATRTLMILWVISLLLVLTIVIGPLARKGLPNLERTAFAHAIGYFALIGLGFMFVQIPLVQRFSVYLGHPTYAVAVILCSMILAAGIGSWISDRLPVEKSLRVVMAIPILIAGILTAQILSLQWIIDSTIQFGLVTRCIIVIVTVGIASIPLGFCFPMGLRLVRRLSEDATPWMWGVNGACGVLATVTAVGISMWSGIDTSLGVAALAYLLLPIPARALWARGSHGVDPGDR